MDGLLELSDCPGNLFSVVVESAVYQRGVIGSSGEEGTYSSSGIAVTWT